MFKPPNSQIRKFYESPTTLLSQLTTSAASSAIALSKIPFTSFWLKPKDWLPAQFLFEGTYNLDEIVFDTVYIFLKIHDLLEHNEMNLSEDNTQTFYRKTMEFQDQIFPLYISPYKQWKSFFFGAQPVAIVFNWYQS